MKILTGVLRGREIFFKPNPHLRPTADKVRKAIVDTLQADFGEKRVLDLFAGTGALGLESLSNGADSVVFVEQEPHQAKKIEETITVLKIKSNVRVICADAFKTMDKLSRSGEQFNLVFLDPPYDEGLALESIHALTRLDLVAHGGIVVWEAVYTQPMADQIGVLKKVREKEYGDTKLGFFIYQ